METRQFHPMIAQSPFSRRPAQKVRDLSQGFLRSQLEDYFHSPPPPGVVETDYSIWKCPDTGLEFCDPPLPGNTTFYEWVSSFPSYYPGHRWEYAEVSRLVRGDRAFGSDSKLLDVGCGKGDFLRELDFLPAGRKYALDLNEPAIRACRDQGLNAYCGTVDAAIEDRFMSTGEFQVVTSFHCLEHVGEPVAFVRELLRATADGGKLFLSTPYSPMSFESNWFDVMNHPPHHMTRWNLAAYRRLAEIVGARFRFFVPKSRPLKQAVQMFRLQVYGANVEVPFAKLVRDILFRFPQFLSGWRKLSQRAALEESGGTDLILIEFTKL